MNILKTNMRFFYYTVILLSLTACAQVYWEKPGVSEQEYAQDRYECERDRRQSYFDENEDGFAQMRFEELCMRSKGYNKIVR